jgi:hypothetical protein
MEDEHEWYPTPAQAAREAAFYEHETELRDSIREKAAATLGQVEKQILDTYGEDSPEWEAFDRWEVGHDWETEVITLADWYASECAGPMPECFGLWLLGVEGP